MKRVGFLEERGPPFSMGEQGRLFVVGVNGIVDGEVEAAALLARPFRAPEGIEKLQELKFQLL